MKGIIGKKIGMTQLYDENGRVVPVTVIEAGPCTVTEIRTEDRDGYTAVQLGYGKIKPTKVKKPLAGFFKKREVEPLRYLKEFRTETVGDLKIGQEINAGVFSEGEYVDVKGISKGKGFAGAMKRHNFRGGSRTHGSHNHRQPNSTGSTDAARVFKGTRKPGHMGSDTVTVQGLKVFRIDQERNLLLVKGAIPGGSNGIVMIRESVKNKK